MLNELIKSIRDVSMESSINVCDAIVGMINKNELVQKYDNECVFGDVIMESMMIFMESKNRERDRTPKNEISKWMEKNDLWYTGNNPNKKKLSNRIYHFLQQHDFNPADGTYRTDIKLKDGTYKRIKLNIEINGRIPLTQREKNIFDRWKKYYITEDDWQGCLQIDWYKIRKADPSEEEIDLMDKLLYISNMTGDKNAFYESEADELYISISALKGKQATSQFMLKHEEGHAYDMKDNGKSKQDLEEISKTKQDSDKHRNDAVEKGMRNNSHDDDPKENYADSYAVKHAKIRTKNNSTRNISDNDLLKAFQSIDRSLREKGLSISIDRVIRDIVDSVKHCDDIIKNTDGGRSFREYVSLSDRVERIIASCKRMGEKQKEINNELSILGKTDNELMELKKELESQLKRQEVIRDRDKHNELNDLLDLVEDFLDGFKPADVAERKQVLQKQLQKVENNEKPIIKRSSNKPLYSSGYQGALSGGKIGLSLSNKDIDEIVSKAKTKKEAETMILNKLTPVVKRIRDKLVKTKSSLEETKKLDNRIKDVSTRVRYEFAKKYIKEYFEELSIDCGYYD